MGLAHTAYCRLLNSIAIAKESEFPLDAPLRHINASQYAYQPEPSFYSVMRERRFSKEVLLVAVASLTTSLIVTPSTPRWIFFVGSAVPCVYLLTTTTGSATVDYLMAFCMVLFILLASDLILLSQPQRDLRWVRQQEPIEDAPIAERAKWGLRLSTSLRSVGWSNEPNVFRPRAVPGTLRTSFIAKKVASMLRWAVAVDAATMYVMQCPAFMKEGVSFALRPWYWKPVDMLFWVTMVEGNAVLVHGAVTLISVALHLSRPEDWTHSFGYWSDAYTIRRFWGRVWHQYLRGFVSAHGKFLARRVLNLQPGTNFSSYVQLYVAFVLSGIMHWVAEYTAGMEWTKSTSVAFFVMQATGIAFEDGVIAAARKLAVGKPRCIHVLGYSWVLAWFYLTLPTWWDPIHRLGLLDMFDRTLFPREWYELAVDVVVRQSASM